MDTKICSKCGCANADTATFCAACGTPLPGGLKTPEFTKQPAAADEAVFCPQCGAKNEAGSTFCSLCGSAIKAAEEPLTGAASQPAASAAASAPQPVNTAGLSSGATTQEQSSAEAGAASAVSSGAADFMSWYKNFVGDDSTIEVQQGQFDASRITEEDLGEKAVEAAFKAFAGAERTPDPGKDLPEDDSDEQEIDEDETEDEAIPSPLAGQSDTPYEDNMSLASGMPAWNMEPPQVTLR